MPKTKPIREMPKTRTSLLVSDEDFEAMRRQLHLTIERIVETIQHVENDEVSEALDDTQIIQGTMERIAEQLASIDSRVVDAE